MSEDDSRIHKHLNNNVNIKNAITNYESSDGTCIDDGIIVLNKEPFRTIEFKCLFANKEYVKNLLSEVKDMKYFRKTADLFSFEQSDDFHNLELGPYTKKFMEVMYKKIKPLFEEIYGVKYSDRISIAASRYKPQDYLLCHDDKCGDRHTAFIYYLCPTWQESQGGLLCLFSHDKSTKDPRTITRRIVPKMNHLLMFKVGNTTYHEVSEVTAKNKERFTINGWFHSATELQDQTVHDVFNPIDPLLAADNLNTAIKFAEYLAPIYNKKTVIKGICDEYRRESSVLLPDFLEKDFFDKCVNELQETSLQWEWIGPPNQRRYEIATFDVDDPWDKLPENLGKLVRCLTAPNFFDYLECLTGERLTGEEVNVEGRAFSMQLQRWSGGCYSLLSDNNLQTSINMLDLNLYFEVDIDSSVVEGQGSVVYSSDDTNVIGVPTCNSLFIVNNKENTGRYIKFLNNILNKKHYMHMMYLTSMSARNTGSDTMDQPGPSSSVIISSDKRQQIDNICSETQNINNDLMDGMNVNTQNRNKKRRLESEKIISSGNVFFVTQNFKKKRNKVGSRTKDVNVRIKNQKSENKKFNGNVTPRPENDKIIKKMEIGKDDNTGKRLSKRHCEIKRNNFSRNIFFVTDGVKEENH